MLNAQGQCVSAVYEGAKADAKQGNDEIFTLPPPKKIMELSPTWVDGVYRKISFMNALCAFENTVE